MPGHYRRRNSLRYPGYDYGHPGAVFVTIDTHQRQRLFGRVLEGQLAPSAAGSMAANRWRGIAARFPAIVLDDFIVMPDHLHGILYTGADPECEAVTVGEVVRWFKSSVHCDYRAGVAANRWPPFEGRLWHRDYHDRVIRTAAELDAIRAYISANPSRWWEEHGDDP